MRRLSDQSRRPAAYRRPSHRLVTLLLVVVVSVSCLAFLSYANWKQQQDATTLASNTAKQNAQIDAQVKITLKKRLDAAKKAEADAKAKAADATPKPTASPSTATTAAQQCDVKDPASITVVINKKHCFNPKNWAPGNLASLDGYLLQNEASERLAALMQAAASAGVGFSLSSAYRSYDNQVVTYNNWVRVNGSVAAADTVSARPGFSEHQTGLAADLKVGNCVLECVGGTASYPWLQQNAAEYGFIERYPDGLTQITGYEPEAWHWRYVGATAAKDMKAKGIQTLETYFGVTGGDYAS